jgi:NAD(P)-dependent dehydrogenase (short-subunit alcohol dehydrogenase family)
MSKNAETVYFITGASRGIGLEFIKQLVKRPNAIVFAGVRNPAAMKGPFPDPPSNLHVVQCDVTSDESVNAAVETAEKTAGRVDVLINNAGIENGFNIRDTSVDSFRSVLETNVVGVHRMTRAFLPLVLKSRVRKIVNMSSDYGSVALNDRSICGAYNTSKAALNMLTVQYKNEYAEEQVIFIPMHPGDVSHSHWITLMLGLYGYERL